MRSVLCLALLVPILALAAGTTQPLTALPPENGTTNVAPAPAPAPANQGPNIPPKALVGTLDTIGGTTYDWWSNGPIYRMIANAGPGNGVHAVWMYCTDVTGQEFLSRRMYYNFYDFSARAWNWIDPDYMVSGVNVFPKKAGYGNVDADPVTGNAVVGGHVLVGADIRPWLARDEFPGAGIFGFADSMGLGVTQWPPVSVGQDGQINIFPITAAYELSYSHIAADSWPTFSTPVTGFVPSPNFPTHSIVASKVSSKVALTWVVTRDSWEGVWTGFVDFSTDGGANWDPFPTELEPPAVYGGDTLTSYYLNSVFPWYDRQDKFHVVANLAPYVNGHIWAIPSHVYHYCPDNDPQWSLIHIMTAETLAGPNVGLGSNATFACRPSIGQDDDGNLFVTWEQFDSLNFEPITSRFRADIFGSKSTDGGLNWGPALKLTDAGSYSMRFPSIVDLAVEGDPDTVFVIYEIDSIAGFYVAPPPSSPEGPATRNPVVVQRIPASDFPTGVAEQPAVTTVRLDAAAKPNPFGRSTRLSYAVPHRGNVSLAIFDAVGRNVRTLVRGRSEAGQFSTTWDGRSQSGALVPEGVYLYRYGLDGKRMTGKLTLTR